MAETVYKKLGKAYIQVDNAAKILYSTVTGKSAIVTSLSIINNNAVSTLTAIVSIADSFMSSLPGGYAQPDTERIYTVSIGPNETVVLDPGIVLDQNKTIIVNGNADLGFSLFGAEIDEQQQYKKFSLSSNGVNNYVSVPTNKSHLYRSILLFNYGGLTQTATLATGNNIGEYSGHTIFVSGLDIAPGETAMIKSGIGASQNETIAISAPGTINVMVFGVELDNV